MAEMVPQLQSSCYSLNVPISKIFSCILIIYCDKLAQPELFIFMMQWRMQLSQFFTRLLAVPHLCKALVINCPVFVGELLEKRPNFLIRLIVVLFGTLHNVQDIIDSDAVFVRLVALHVVERSVEPFLAGGDLHVRVGHQQLLVVNLALMVNIDMVKPFLNGLVIVHVALVQNFLQFVERNMAVFLTVHFVKCLMQLFLLLF
mmetsp:Transcript_19123/g.31165  ORF Transcript_19123/g.31165 Transcript_19123/m.31165 type:complete len:202 (-) Transcript_19123:1270-1875(-)